MVAEAALVLREDVRVVEKLDFIFSKAKLSMDLDGTEPVEGMGIAIAILEELRKSGCMFIVTTHYPEVKEYADKTTHIINAAYGKEMVSQYHFTDKEEDKPKDKGHTSNSKIVRRKQEKSTKNLGEKFQIGDSVMIYPDKKLGIVCEKMNEKGVFIAMDMQQYFPVNSYNTVSVFAG